MNAYGADKPVTELRHSLPLGRGRRIDGSFGQLADASARSSGVSREAR